MDIWDRVWANLIRTKFQSFYLSNFNSFIRGIERAMNIIGVLATAGSAGGLYADQGNTILWLSIIGLAQITNLVKPFLPYLKDSEKAERWDMYLKLESLHLQYDNLWRSKVTDKRANSDFSKLKNIEFDSEVKLRGQDIPSIGYLVRKTNKQWDDYLRIEYNIN